MDGCAMRIQKDYKGPMADRRQISVNYLPDQRLLFLRVELVEDSLQLVELLSGLA